MKQFLLVFIFIPFFVSSQGYLHYDPQILYDEPGGLYDSDLIRDLSVVFEDPNYHSVLVNSFFNNPTYRIPATVTLDDEVCDSVGVRYKGNSTFCIPYYTGNTKLPYNLDFNEWISGQKLMGYKKIKLANALFDPTYSKEFLAATLYKKYLPSFEVNLLKLHVQGNYLGLYANTESINKQFLTKHFGEKDGVLFKCDPAGMFCGDQVPGEPNLNYLGEDSVSYFNSYSLKSDNGGWAELMELIYTLNFNPGQLGEYLNIDRVLWAFAVNTVLANYDTYNGYNVRNYYFYQTEDGLFQMIPWDLSESFLGGIMGWSFWNPSDVYEFDPYFGADPIEFLGNTYIRPLTQQILNDPTYRKQYTAHIRTVINESMDVNELSSVVSQLQDLAYHAASSDPNKLFEMSQYSSNVQSPLWMDWNSDGITPDDSGFGGILSTVNERKNYLLSHPEISMIPPVISNVSIQGNSISAELANASEVDLMGTISEYNSKFEVYPMNDNGLNGDLVSGDGVFTAQMPDGLSGDVVFKFYIRAQNAQAMALSPERAEYEFYMYSKDLSVTESVDFNSNRELLRIVDLLGRDSEISTNQPLLYIYDDGSVEKRVILGN